MEYIENFLRGIRSSGESNSAPTPDPPELPCDAQRQLKKFTGEFRDLPAVTDVDPAGARKIIRQIEEEYLDIVEPDHILLFRGTPGIGKTYAGTSIAHYAYGLFGKTTLYLGARHDFYGDITRAVTKQSLPVSLWTEWLPQQIDEKDDARTTCVKTDYIRRWQKRGYASFDFCMGVCGEAYIKKECGYHAQRRTATPIVYGQHQHLTTGHALAADAGLIIGDESPLTTFLNRIDIPPKFMECDNIENPGVALLLEKMRALCTSGVCFYGPTLLERLGGAEAVSEMIRYYRVPLSAVAPPPITDEREVDSVPYNFLASFVPVLKREVECALRGERYIWRIMLTGEGLSIFSRKFVNEKMPKHIIWFDATGDPNLYELMFGRKVRVVNLRPKMKGKIIQIIDRANGKTSLMKSKMPDGSVTSTGKTTQAHCLINHITRGCEKVGVITFKSIEDKFASEKCEVSHFYANRGSNAMEKIPVIAVLGTPQPPLVQIETIAKSLLNDRMEPFDTSWVVEDVPYRSVDSEGNRWCYPVSNFRDATLRSIMEQFREYEILQSAHRNRPLTNQHVVYLLTNIPVDELPPDQIVTMRDLVGAPLGVNIFDWSVLIEICEKIELECGAVRVDELAERMGVSRTTALKYFDMLTDTGEWETALVKKDAKGGRPSASLLRTKRTVA
jgi:hypothetical protein